MYAAQPLEPLTSNLALAEAPIPRFPENVALSSPPTINTSFP